MVQQTEQRMVDRSAALWALRKACDWALSLAAPLVSLMAAQMAAQMEMHWAARKVASLAAHLGYLKAHC